MSYLAIDEIRGKTSGTPTDVNNLKYQIATAWVNFDGTGTVSIRDSFNVSSITDVSTGVYTANFATAMDNANYATCPGGGRPAQSDRNVIAIPIDINSCDIRSENYAATKFDVEHVLLSVFGGKT